MGGGAILKAVQRIKKRKRKMAALESTTSCVKVELKQ